MHRTVDRSTARFVILGLCDVLDEGVSEPNDPNLAEKVLEGLPAPKDPNVAAPNSEEVLDPLLQHASRDKKQKQKQKGAKRKCPITTIRKVDISTAGPKACRP